MSPTKRVNVRCEFYTDAGQPITGPRRFGPENGQLAVGCPRRHDRCWFVHPSDPAWPTARIAPPMRSPMHSKITRSEQPRAPPLSPAPSPPPQLERPHVDRPTCISSPRLRDSRSPSPHATSPNKRVRTDDTISHRERRSHCVTAAAARNLQECYAGLSAGTAPHEIAKQVTTGLWALPNTWPPRGRIIVHINTSNDDSSAGKRFLPRSKQLDPGRPPLDLTPYVRYGENMVKITQIGSAEEYVFLLPVTRPHL